MRPNIDTIRARRADIARQLNVLRSEDEELATVESILEKLQKGGGWKSQAKGALVARRGRPPATRTEAKATRRGRKAGKKGGGGADNSQRELVLAALKKSNPAWLNVRQIIDTVKQSHGVAIPPRSLSPLLSNMKKSGAIVRNGRLVALPERARAR